MIDVQNNSTKTQMLLKKWGQVLNHPSMAPLTESKKRVVAAMLDTQYSHMKNPKGKSLNEDMSVGNFNSVQDVQQYDSILIPMLRRVAPDLIGLDLLGTQPMDKPTQLIFAMRAHYTGNDTTNQYPLPGQNPMGSRLPFDNRPNSAAANLQYYEMVKVVNIGSINPTTNYNVGDVLSNDWSGGTQTKYALVLYVEKTSTEITMLIERLDAGKLSHRQVGFTAGTLTPFFTKNDVIVPDIADPSWSVAPYVFVDLPDEGMYNAVLAQYSGSYDRETGEQMGREINQMNLSIDKVSVTAKTRILKTRYSFEVAEDLKNLHGMDAENELINILSYEILAEMNREIVEKIKFAAFQGGTRSYEYSNVDGRWSQERFRTLYNLINKVASEIAISTRRGNGNFIICSMDVKVALDSLDGYVQWSDVNTSFNTNSAIAYAGMIAGKFKVYVDTFATRDYAIVGYKGESEMDAGIFYCPYIPLNMVRAVGQDDFQPRIGFRTRYGLADNPFGAKLYYRYIDTTGLSYAFGDGPIPFTIQNV
jgi:hypothetical protein